jgi:hypothetical protein
VFSWKRNCSISRFASFHVLWSNLVLTVAVWVCQQLRTKRKATTLVPRFQAIYPTSSRHVIHHHPASTQYWLPVVYQIALTLHKLESETVPMGCAQITFPPINTEYRQFYVFFNFKSLLSLNEMMFVFFDNFGENMLRGFLSPQHGGTRIRPPDMEGSCEWIE